MVSVEEPLPVTVAGLNPPLVTPAGNPDSLPTLSVTGPLKPLSGLTVTVKVAAAPGVTVCEAGLTVSQKSAVGGSTQIVRVGGLGSELPLPSITVSEATYVPGVSKVTLPGCCAVDVPGEPPGKTHEYCAALVLVSNGTLPPAVIHTSEAGDVMAPLGGVVA